MLKNYSESIFYKQKMFSYWKKKGKNLIKNVKNYFNIYFIKTKCSALKKHFKIQLKMLKDYF